AVYESGTDRTAAPALLPGGSGIITLHAGRRASARDPAHALAPDSPAGGTIKPPALRPHWPADQTDSRRGTAAAARPAGLSRTGGGTVRPWRIAWTETRSTESRHHADSERLCDSGNCLAVQRSAPGS